jgi:hypothetical protein
VGVAVFVGVEGILNVEVGVAVIINFEVGVGLEGINDDDGLGVILVVGV